MTKDPIKQMPQEKKCCDKCISANWDYTFNCDNPNCSCHSPHQEKKEAQLCKEILEILVKVLVKLEVKELDDYDGGWNGALEKAQSIVRDIMKGIK